MGGNSVATGISQAGMAKGDPKTSDCEKLSNANEERREELKSKTNDKSLVGARGTGKGTTVSSAKVKKGRRSVTKSAHNNQKAYEKCTKNLEKGGCDSVRSGSKRTLCGNYTHPDPAVQKSGHAEARILDSLGSNPGVVTFNIDWRRKGKANSKMPCLSCHRMMCAAEKCGFKIFICGRDNTPYRVPCEPTRENRLALKKLVDRKRR